MYKFTPYQDTAFYFRNSTFDLRNNGQEISGIEILRSHPCFDFLRKKPTIILKAGITYSIQTRYEQTFSIHREPPTFYANLDGKRNNPYSEYYERTAIMDCRKLQVNDKIFDLQSNSLHAGKKASYKQIDELLRTFETYVLELEKEIEKVQVPIETFAR